MKPQQEQETTHQLEESVELMNVTKLRQELLPIIARLEDDPALRFLILKNSKPQAVLMSVQTYELMKKLLRQVQEQIASMTREERIESAVNQLRSERGRGRTATKSGDRKRPATEQIEVVVDMLQQLKQELRRHSSTKAETVE